MDINELVKRNSMNRRLMPRNRRSGQAIIEFTICLVVVLALLAGLLQLASLTRAHTETRVAARRQAAQLAMTGLAPLSSADHIKFLDPGPDGKPYTRDDDPSPGSPSDFQSIVVDKDVSAPSDWADILGQAPRNQISTLHASVIPIQTFGLVEGSDSRSVNLLPVTQHLIYDAPSIRVESKVFMTAVGGIY